jgi:hypothetical protein
MARIYISSTYNDLKNEREDVYRTLRKMGHDVMAMEDYVATDQRPLEKCLGDVAGCDIYVGIFAWRYGYVPLGQERSITELEFREAVSKKKPCLLFLLDEDAPWPGNLQDHDPKAYEALSALKAELRRDYLVSTFRTADDLAVAVSVAIAVKVADLPSSSVKPIADIPNSGRIIFSDDFTSGTLSDVWQPVSGKWYVEDAVLNGVGAHYTGSRGREWAAITVDKDIPDDCSVSFRIRIVDGSTAELMLHLSSNRYIRVYLYEIDQALYLGEGTFIENNRPGELGLEEVLSSIGGGRTLATQGFPVKVGVWYRITATAAGNEYTVKVGGQKLIKYIDKKKTLSPEGTIGLLTNGHVQFDDIVVTAR